MSNTYHIWSMHSSLMGQHTRQPIEYNTIKTYREMVTYTGRQETPPFWLPWQNKVFLHLFIYFFQLLDSWNYQNTDYGQSLFKIHPFLFKGNPVKDLRQTEGTHWLSSRMCISQIITTFSVTCHLLWRKGWLTIAYWQLQKDSLNLIV